MSNTRLDGSSEALNRAAAWLRQHLAIPPEDTIFQQFEQHFGCCLAVENREDPWYCPTWAEFSTEQDLTMFLLRWS